MVADQRERHHHDLAGVARIGTDLLVAGLGCVHDEVATSANRGPERDAAEDGSVLEREQARPAASDAWIDDGISW